MRIELVKQWLWALELNLPVIEDYGDKEQLNRQRKAITSIYDAIRQVREQAEKQEPVGHEKYRAILEGRRNASEDAYFAARSADDSDFNRVLFRHGFNRGYDAATPPTAQPAAPLSYEDMEILEAVHREMGEDDDGNAPGHGHRIPGIWDKDNGELAGKPCAWCLTWSKFTTLIKRAKNGGGQ